MRVSRTSPSISHLMFINDLILFAEANTEQVDQVMSCLNAFCSLLGLKVNLSKTSIIFSRNLGSKTKQTIQ